MPTALLGWELGGGLGHTTLLLHVAKALADLGVRPVLALQSLANAESLLAARDIQVIQAPVPPFLAGRDFVARSYSDLLVAHGFAEPDRLVPVLAGWDRIVEELRPDVVVADHAPALLLAATGRVPAVKVGNGFTVPPTDRSSFPPLTEAEPMLPEIQLLAALRAVLTARGQAAPSTVPAAFTGEAAVACVFPDLDAYQATRANPAAGPLLSPLPPTPPPDRDSFFAYLAADVPRTEQVLLELAGSLPGRAFVRGVGAEQNDRLVRAGIQVLTGPASLEEELSACSLLVHHASLGAAQAGLAAGRAQLCLPRHLEQRITALRLERLGVGTSISHPLDVALPAALQRTSDMSARASQVAGGLATQGYTGSLGEVLRSVQDALL